MEVAKQESNLIPLLGFLKGRKMVLKHVDRAMPKYQGLCYLLLREIENISIKSIAFGEDYYIETDGFGLVRTLGLSDNKDSVMLYSRNDETHTDGSRKYPYIEVHISEIKGLYKVLGMFEKISD